jgi:hypothetical protein
MPLDFEAQTVNAAGLANLADTGISLAVVAAKLSGDPLVAGLSVGGIVEAQVSNDMFGASVVMPDDANARGWGRHHNTVSQAGQS